MITYKVFLDNRRPKAGNKYPLMFRITYNRKTTTYSTGLSIRKEHWNEDSCLINNLCPNFKELNKNLTSKFLKVQKLLLQMEDEGSFSFESFKEKFHEKPVEIKKTVTFLTYSNQVIADLHEVKRTGNAVVYQTAVNRLMAFCNDKQLKFEQIDYSLLDRFKHQLIKEGAKPNTIGNYFRSIRAIYNKAIKAKLVDRSRYPFTEISIKTEKTAKRAIASDALTGLSRLEVKQGSKEWHARNYLFLSFAFRGMSFTDMAYLKHSNIVNGRMQYRRRKTHKSYSIKMTKLAIELLKRFNSNSIYLLPVLTSKVEEDSLKSKKVIQQWIKTTNKYLKRLGKQLGVENLTTYVARHTWATTAKRLGYSNELIAECLGHEYGNKITNIYLDSFDQSVIDDVNEKVIKLIG